MQLEVDKIPQRGREFRHIYAPGELQLEDAQTRFIGDVEIIGRAARKSDGVSLQGNINAQVEVLCDRCLSPVAVHVDTPFEATYVPVEEANASESTALRPVDMSFSPLDGDAIDVDQLVCEQVLLALPIRMLCHPECKGLCASCGMDLNLDSCNCEKIEVDARWAALAALKQNQ